MATPTGTPPSTANRGLPRTPVYVMSAVCFLLGLIVGYFCAGNRVPSTVTRARQTASVAPTVATPIGGHPKLTMEQMKEMADVQASALIEKSKADPKNVGLLTQIAGLYEGAHQFREAASYFDKALKISPKDVSIRTEMASCLYYSGDVDGALAQLNLALKYNPKDANSLFNLGMIRYKGKNDPKGAIAAWEELLKTNPNLDRRAIVEKMIAEARAGSPKN